MAGPFHLLVAQGNLTRFFQMVHTWHQQVAGAAEQGLVLMAVLVVLVAPTAAVVVVVAPATVPAGLSAVSAAKAVMAL